MIELSLTFLRIGLVFFGGGFVLIPIIQDVVVHRLGWLTTSQFVDGVAISQLTPGPIAVLATFVGYHQAGPAGALLATAAVFLPAVLLMLVLSAGYQRWQDQPLVEAAMSGIVPAIVGLVAAAGLRLGATTLHGARDAILLVVSLTLLLRYKVNPAWLLLAAALLGLATTG